MKKGFKIKIKKLNVVELTKRGGRNVVNPES